MGGVAIDMTAGCDVKAGLRNDAPRVMGVETSTIDARVDVRAIVGDSSIEMGPVVVSGVTNPTDGLCSCARRNPASPSDMIGDTKVCTGVPLAPACGVSSNEEIPGDFKRLLRACG
jgi:hypothetical protein